MNIGFDLDKIFIDYPPFVPDKLIDFLYKQKSNGILKYRIPSKPEQFFRLLTHNPLLRPPIKKNIKFIKELAKKNANQHYLISSRFSFLEKRTGFLIKKYEFDKIFNGMYFNFQNKQPHIFKNKIIKKLKIDRYVDDDLPLLQFLAKNNPGKKFYWFNNNSSGPLGINLFAIKILSEILKI